MAKNIRGFWRIYLNIILWILLWMNGLLEWFEIGILLWVLPWNTATSKS